MKIHTILGILAAAILSGCCTHPGSPKFSCGTARKTVVPAILPPNYGSLAVVYGPRTSQKKHRTTWTLNGTDWNEVGDAPKILRKGPQVVQFLSHVDTDLPPAGVKIEIPRNAVTTIFVSYQRCTPGESPESHQGTTPARTTRADNSDDDIILSPLDTGHQGTTQDVPGSYSGSGQLQVIFQTTPKHKTEWYAKSAGPYLVGDPARTVQPNSYRIQYVCKVAGHTGPAPHVEPVVANKKKIVSIYYTNP